MTIYPSPRWQSPRGRPLVPRLQGPSGSPLDLPSPEHFLLLKRGLQCQGQFFSHPYTLPLVQTDVKLSDSERQRPLRAS